MWFGVFQRTDFAAYTGANKSYYFILIRKYLHDGDS